MVEAHGGNPRIADDPSLLPAAADVALFRAPRRGFLARLRAEPLGRASHALGAGRTAVGEAVDHGVGVTLLAAPGDALAEAQPILQLHHRGGRGLDTALAFCRAAVTVSDAPPEPRPAVLADVRADRQHEPGTGNPAA
jgi:thymidine phosphorylase